MVMADAPVKYLASLSGGSHMLKRVDHQESRRNLVSDVKGTRLTPHSLLCLSFIEKINFYLVLFFKKDCQRRYLHNVQTYHEK